MRLGDCGIGVDTRKLIFQDLTPDNLYTLPMKLREYQAKKIFRERSLLVPDGDIATSAEEAGDVASRLTGPVVIKPQLGVKGRGKVGGIGFAGDPGEARAEAGRLLAMTIKGEEVKVLLVEKRLPFEQELYVAVAIDYATRRPVLIASEEGGVEIENVASENPDRVLRIGVDILHGPTATDLEQVANRFGAGVSRHLEILYGIFRDYDAEMVEINPLARLGDRSLVALDAVLNINEDSTVRHPELAALAEELPPEDPITAEAAANKWTYIELPGDIGILSSGAGLTMAILDLINAAGGEAANFLDTAQIDDEGIYSAFDLLVRAGRSRVLLVNIFAGLNRCDTLAAGICRYMENHDVELPVVVRMVGNQEEEGHRLLREAGMEPFSDLEQAIERVVMLSKESA